MSVQVPVPVCKLCTAQSKASKFFPIFLLLSAFMVVLHGLAYKLSGFALVTLQGWGCRHAQPCLAFSAVLRSQTQVLLLMDLVRSGVLATDPLKATRDSVQMIKSPFIFTNVTELWGQHKM